MNPNAVIVNSVIAVLRLVLNALQWIEVPIQILQAAIAKHTIQIENHDTSTIQTVVIVGGNFAGLAALWELLSKEQQPKKRYKIVLIDQNEYSEYVPGNLRLFCEPFHFSKITQLLPSSDKHKNFQFLQGKVTNLVNEKNEKILTYLPTSTVSNNGTTTNIVAPQTLHYDYAIVTTGATYTAPISPTSKEHTLAKRYQGWQAAHARLHKAQSIIILGGGAVGVELAAEIAHYYNHDNEGDDETSTKMMRKKKITLLDAQSRLVPMFPTQVGEYAEQCLQNKGVILRLGQSLQSWTDTTCTLQDGTVLKADIVYVCFGSKSNSLESSTNFASTASPWCSLDARRNIVVNDTLQVVSASADSSLTPSWSGCIFAAGDVASPPTNADKQAFQAEMQGKVAARNVWNLLQQHQQPQQSLQRYPDTIAGSSEMPFVFVLSLGPHDGVLGFNSLVIPGPLAAIVKWILEYTKVLHMKGSLLGRLIWKIGDATVLFLSRTVILPSKPINSNVLPVTVNTKRVKAA